MKTRNLQNRIKNFVVLGIFSAGTLLAGTGCDLDILDTAWDLAGVAL